MWCVWCLMGGPMQRPKTGRCLIHWSISAASENRGQWQPATGASPGQKGLESGRWWILREPPQTDDTSCSLLCIFHRHKISLSFLLLVCLSVLFHMFHMFHSFSWSLRAKQNGRACHVPGSEDYDQIREISQCGRRSGNFLGGSHWETVTGLVETVQGGAP